MGRIYRNSLKNSANFPPNLFDFGEISHCVLKGVEAVERKNHYFIPDNQVEVLKFIARCLTAGTLQESDSEQGMEILKGELAILPPRKC